MEYALDISTSLLMTQVLEKLFVSVTPFQASNAASVGGLDSQGRFGGLLLSVASLRPRSAFQLQRVLRPNLPKIPLLVQARDDV